MRPLPKPGLSGIKNKEPKLEENVAGWLSKEHMETKLNAAESHSWLARASFFLRSKGLQAQRLAQNSLRRMPLLRPGVIGDYPYVLAESISDLRTATDPREQQLILGKIQNLRVACRSLHARVLAPGETFSLWRQIGPPWPVRGFAGSGPGDSRCRSPVSWP